jgi:alkylation response protein AidB-like acyl-CoA dehydrogenase
MVAEMRPNLEAIDASLARICEEWATLADHGADWPLKIVAAKHFLVTKAFEVVDTPMGMTGGAGVLKRNRLEQLFRDARLGRMHPGNRMATIEIVGKAALGLDPDEQPRWG